MTVEQKWGVAIDVFQTGFVIAVIVSEASWFAKGCAVALVVVKQLGAWITQRLAHYQRELIAALNEREVES